MRSSDWRTKRTAQKLTHYELEIAAHNGSQQAMRLLDSCTCSRCALRNKHFGKYIRDNATTLSVDEPEF